MYAFAVCYNPTGRVRGAIGTREAQALMTTARVTAAKAASGG